MRSLVAIVFATLFAAAVPAHGILINFQTLADGAGAPYGESVFQPLNVLADFGVDVDFDGYATIGGVETHVFAYLDRGNAGLGTCKILNAAGTAQLGTKNPGSGSNLCNPGSDDNVTMDELIRITANEAITIDNLWLNNNHDIDRSLNGDTVMIGMDSYLFSLADHVGDGDFLYAGPISLMAGEWLDIKYVDEQFYLGAIEITKVPEPGTLGLFAIGLAALVMQRRRVAR